MYEFTTIGEPYYHDLHELDIYPIGDHQLPEGIWDPDQLKGMTVLIDGVDSCTCQPGSDENGWHEVRCDSCDEAEREQWREFWKWLNEQHLDELTRAQRLPEAKHDNHDEEHEG